MRNGGKKPDVDQESAGVTKGRRVHVRAPSRGEYKDATAGPQPPSRSPSSPPSASPEPSPSSSPTKSRKSNANDVTRKR